MSHAAPMDMPVIAAMRKRHFDRYNVHETPRGAYEYVICRDRSERILACLGYEEHATGILIDDLYADESRLGKGAAGAILKWIHEFADARGKTLCAVTMHGFIVEHVLRRGWQVAGMAIVRPVGET